MNTHMHTPSSNRYSALEDLEIENQVFQIDISGSVDNQANLALSEQAQHNEHQTELGQSALEPEEQVDDVQPFLRITPYKVNPIFEFYDSKTMVKLFKNEVPATIDRNDTSAVGQWILREFIKAAIQLYIFIFIKPIANGGLIVPQVPSLEEYQRAFESQTASSALFATTADDRQLVIRSNQSSMHTISLVITRLSGDANKLQTARSAHDDIPVDQRAARGKWAAERETIEDQLAQIQDKLSSAEVKFGSLITSNYQQKEAVALQHERALKAQVHDTTAASSHFKQDCAAANNIKERFVLLIEFALIMIKPFLEVTRVLRTFVKLSNGTMYDPLERGDLRSMYATALRHFRQTTMVQNIMGLVAMIKRQKTSRETIREFAHFLEEYIRAFSDVRLTQISITDLASVLLLAGMSNAEQMLFLREQEQARHKFSIDTGDVKEDATVGGTLRGHADLWEEVLTFVTSGDSVLQQHKMISSNTRAPRAGSDALVAAVSDNKCFAFEKTGDCKRGDQCRFAHTASTSGSAAGGGGSSKSKTPSTGSEDSNQGCCCG
jgi:hypothetical protein